MNRRKTAARKPIPRFVSEEAERRCWAKHDTTEHFDWGQAAGGIVAFAHYFELLAQVEPS